MEGEKLIEVLLEVALLVVAYANLFAQVVSRINDPIEFIINVVLVP